MKSFPQPPCETCAREIDCAQTNRLQPDYPDCRRPLRGLDREGTRLLFEAWQRRQRVPAEPWESLRQRVLERWAVDSNQYSEVFEPSFSWDESGPHYHRLSYAFPGFHSDPEGVARSLEAMAAPFGAAAVECARKLARAARHDAVAQPLFGFADDGARGRRVKLYLQFRDGAGDSAVTLARALTGSRVAPDGVLHMVGLDVGERGLRAVKLYVVPRAAPRVDGLAVARVLSVHRLDDPAKEARPVDLDFSLVENGLTQADFFASPIAARHAQALSAFAELRAEFRVAVRRVSISVEPGEKLTLYYAPAAGF